MSISSHEPALQEQSAKSREAAYERYAAAFKAWEKITRDRDAAAVSFTRYTLGGAADLAAQAMELFRELDDKQCAAGQAVDETYSEWGAASKVAREEGEGATDGLDP